MYKFPLTCAPLIGDDQVTGWDTCMNNCSSKKCKQCVPNPDTECGQEVIGSGIGCVPKTCLKDCCLSEKYTEKANNMLENFRDNRSYRVFIPLSILIVFIVIGLVIYFTGK